MPEAYTYGGDTLIETKNQNWSAQSFLIMEDQVLHYIDLELQGGLVMPEPVVLVFHHTPGVGPWGDYISRNDRTTERYCTPWKIGRARFLMSPVALFRGSHYAIVVQNYPMFPPNKVEWQYDAGDGQYPRGYRMSSIDTGATWTHHTNDDHMFAVIGAPPLPKPELTPPILNFAALGITYANFTYGVKVILVTSVPCCLYCYHTIHPPKKFVTERVTRGLAMPWHVYFSFSAYRRIWQQELGDTLVHTFFIPGWPACETRWLTFRGSVDNIDSPSIGPIFEHHNSPPPFSKFEYFDASYNTALGTSSTVKLAQSFTPQTSHIIHEVHLLLTRKGNPGLMNLYIESTHPGGRPTDIILTSGTFDPYELPTGPTWNAEWFTIPVTPFELVAGTEYAIVVEGGNDLNGIRWNAQSAGGYPRGRGWYWRPAPWFWWGLFTYDLLFEEWGYPV